MVREPGDLGALGKEGRDLWSRRVTGALEGAGASEAGPLLVAADERTEALTVVDWTGYPVRVEACLGRRRAVAVLDGPAPPGRPAGPRPLQEEYLEWRTVRDSRGAVTRVEFTTELPDYWRVLAATEPAATIALVAELAGREEVESRAVYGDLDPFAAATTAEMRERAFESTMLNRAAPSPLNDGDAAICCLLHPSNRLADLVTLAGRAAQPLLVRDSDRGRRYPAAPEAIALLDLPATPGRMSDPVLVERLGRLALERRLIGFDDPPGVYIAGVERTRLRAPDGSPAPAECFRFSRGRGAADSRDGLARHQRLAIEVSPDAGFALSDLTDAATGEPIRSGAQLADLVQLVVRLRVSGPGALRGRPRELPAPARVSRWGDCRPIRSIARRHEAEREG